jgi:hypothetical protein
MYSKEHLMPCKHEQLADWYFIHLSNQNRRSFQDNQTLR